MPAADTANTAPWFWRQLPLENRTGAEIFAGLFAQDEIAVLLESPPASPQARYSICAGQPRWGQVWLPQLGEIFPCLRQFFDPASNSPENSTSIPAHLPFTGGWLGWLGYDLAWEIEQLPYTRPDTLPLPVAFWYQPDCFAVLDHQEDQLWLAASEASKLSSLALKLQDSPPPPHLPRPQAPLSPPELALSQAAYENAVHQAKKYIYAGDIFQANLSLRFSTTGNLEPWSLYRHLQAINPSPFSCYYQTPWGCVVSCSPERLVRVQDRCVETRPIAGTRPRGDNAAHDQALAQELLHNPKERAEHIMLVDLERNDLGQVCEWGSVKVDELLVLEYYSHVIHLVSNIRGTLKPDISGLEVIQAVFPGGTITGCPKVRCLEIIEELEPVRRNLFYGSCGYIDWRGHLDLNILIRTLLINPERTQAWGQIGAGIVADSDPTREWQESLQKAEALLQAIQTAAFS